MSFDSTTFSKFSDWAFRVLLIGVFAYFGNRLEKVSEKLEIINAMLPVQTYQIGEHERRLKDIEEKRLPDMDRRVSGLERRP